MTDELTLDVLSEWVRDAAAVRLRQRLQPCGGPGDKIFPPTYQGGIYATEQRLDPRTGEKVNCVLLDSVQSQANRLEEALLRAYDEGLVTFPLIVVDFSEKYPEFGQLVMRGKPGWLTSLEVPHRIADALLIESRLNGTPFRARKPGQPESEEGKRFARATIRNATAVFELCPTALLFGVWDSTGARGGLGNKFPRVLCSEIVGVRAVEGIRTASRIDPTGIEKCNVYESVEGEWTVDPKQARKDQKGRMLLYGRNRETRGKPSAINLGNVTPDIVRAERSNDPLPGGVTVEYAEQTAVLSFAGLRRLSFPGEDGNVSLERDQTAHVVLAMLGLAALALQREHGYFLRSRCHLVAEDEAPFELVGRTAADKKEFMLTAEQACGLCNEAADRAKRAGLPWREEPLVLQPEERLIELIEKAREEAVEASEEDAV